MPIIESDTSEVSEELSKMLVNRFRWNSGFYLDKEYSDEPCWLVSSSGFAHWFELLQENLQLNLGRRLAHAAADSEELRLDSIELKHSFFQKRKKILSEINYDWKSRGLGSLKVPSGSHKLKKLELEVHGRLQSSFSSGMANSAWEFITKKRHRFRWEDRGKDVALAHLEQDGIEVKKPIKIDKIGAYKSIEFNEIDSNPLRKPFELKFGGWELLGERHIFLYQDFIYRLVENITTYASDSYSVSLNADWEVFQISETEKKVWSGIAQASSEMFRQGGELFMIDNPQGWVGASQAELVNKGLGAVTKSKGIDSNGGIELEFCNIFHPAIVTGVILGCWSRSEGRDGKASWKSDNGELKLQITSKSEIAEQ